MVELLAVAATLACLAWAAAGIAGQDWLTGRRVVPVLSWLTLAVLLWLEAFAVRTGSSTLGLLLVADALALWYALSIRGQLLHARLRRLDRQRSQHRARLRSSTPRRTAPNRLGR